MKTLFALALLLIVVPCCAQNTDSLKKIVNSSQPAEKRLKAAVSLSSYFSTKNTDETFMAAKTGLSLAAKLNDKKAEGGFLRDIGKAYYLKGSYDSTAYFLYKSVDVFEKLKDEDNLAGDYHELGKLYAKIKNYKKAIEFYDKVIAYSQKTGAQNAAMTALNQLGTVYEDEQNYPEALNRFKQSLAIAQKLKDSISVSYSLDFIGDVLGSMNRKDEAEQYLLKALDIRKSLHDTLAMAINYINLGILYREKKDYPKSFDALQRCLLFATKIKYTDLESGVLKELSDTYEQTGNYRQSLIYFKKYKDLNDAVYNDRSSKNMAELQTKYEATQREKLIQQQQFEISKRNYWVAGIFVVLLLGLLLSYVYYKHQRLKQRNLATQAIIETEEKERKRIAQDLHDSVSQMISTAKINLTVVGSELQFANKEQKDRFQKVVHLIDDSFNEVRIISHNMMPHALHETGLAQVVKQLLDNIDPDIIKINFYSKGFETHFDSRLETILYRIIQECVNNAIKHSGAGKLDISLTRDNDGISITVEDNGKGFDASLLAGAEGIGIKNIQNRVRFLHGNFEIDSTPGHGTVIVIRV